MREIEREREREREGEGEGEGEGGREGEIVSENINALFVRSFDVPDNG